MRRATVLPSAPAETAPAETAPADPALRPSPDRYRLVIFDFDGTLADTYDWFAGLINEVADRYGFRRIELHEAETVRRMSARQAMQFVGIPAWKLPFISRHMRRLATRDIDGVRLFAGIEPMLIELDRRGVMLASVSSNSEANVRHALGPLSERFRHFACGAALFRKARRLDKVMRACGAVPGETLAVGDEIRDLEASRKVGCAFGAVSWGYTRPDAIEALKPDFVFRSPEDIASAVTGARR